VEDRLVSGTLETGGERVDLRRIDYPLFLLGPAVPARARCSCWGPLFLLGGARDHIITPPARVFAAADYVSTPRADVGTHVNSGGHLGLFMGSRHCEHWPPMLAAVIARLRRG
jgi:poly(3-hydroxyalkanoate) synthetase